MTNTNKSSRKEEREWQDLQHEKKAYLKRVQEKEDADKLMKRWRDLLNETEEDNNSPPL